MFIWEWVLIAFGWLVFFGLFVIIAGTILAILTGFKNRKQVIQNLDRQEQTAINRVEFDAVFIFKKGTEKMESWKERFKKEYYELRERFQKLDMMIGQYEKGQLEFEPKCPIDLLKGQRSTMWNYLKILEQRAKIEEIKL